MRRITSTMWVSDLRSFRGVGRLREAQPRQERLLRRDPRPHELVSRRVRHREHPDHSGRRVQVLQGRADQAPAGLRGQDRHAARLGGRHGSLGIRRRHSARQRPEVSGQQDPPGGASHSEGEDEGGDGEGRAVRHQHAGPRAAGQGAHVPGDRRLGLEEEHRARQPGEPAREIHGLLLLRVDRDAEQHESPPQHLLQGVLARPGDALQRAGVLPSGGSLELDGRTAEGGQRGPRHLAQCQSLGRPHVPDRGGLQGPPDRRRLRRVARCATSR